MSVRDLIAFMIIVMVMMTFLTYYPDLAMIGGFIVFMCVCVAGLVVCMYVFCDALAEIFKDWFK